MIDKTLSFLSNILNEHIKNTFNLDDNIVVLGSMINQDGSLPPNIKNKIVLSVINLERENTLESKAYDQKNKSNIVSKLNLNMYLLISANYDSVKYLEALKMLSAIVKFVNFSSSLTHHNHSNLPPDLSKMNLEILNVPLNEIGLIWNGIGAKYVPSMVCKVYMIASDKNDFSKKVNEISLLQTKYASTK